MGCSPWGRTESDTTEATWQQQQWLSDTESTCNAGPMGLIPGLRRSPEEGNATHSSILAWKIPWTAEPCGLQAMGLQNSQT